MSKAFDVIRTAAWLLGYILGFVPMHFLVGVVDSFRKADEYNEIK